MFYLFATVRSLQAMLAAGEAAGARRAWHRLHLHALCGSVASARDAAAVAGAAQHAVEQRFVGELAKQRAGLLRDTATHRMAAVVRRHHGALLRVSLKQWQAGLAAEWRAQLQAFAGPR